MPSVANDPALKPMIDAALKAAHIALLRRKENVNVRTKDDGSKVTAGDYQSQQIIKDELEKISPSIAKQLGVDKIGFIMEESIDGNQPNFAARNSGAHWVVDPIDGTHGYSRKHGDKAEPWGISIALEKDGQTIAAVIYEAAANEYGTSPADFTSIDPSHPKGNVFFAHKNAEKAYKLEGNNGGFSVAGSGTYPQITRKVGDGAVYELPVLTCIPDLTVDFSQAQEKTLNDEKLKPGAKPYLDGFYQDGQTRNTATQTTYKKSFIEKLGLKGGEYDDCYSAVAGAMRAADGRVNAYLAGRCYPWDASAARLILEKSGTNVAEYRVGDGHDERSMLIAGRDSVTFKKINDTIATMRDDSNQPLVGEPTGTTTRRGFMGTIVAAIGAALGLTAAPKVAAQLQKQVVDAPQQPAVNPTVMDRLPASVEALEQLSDEQKILLAACTASGCDAVAYYTPNEAGSYSQAHRVNMYPPEYYAAGVKQPDFKSVIDGFQLNTHSGEAELRANDYYHIPVYATTPDGKPTESLKGIVVLHAPSFEFSKLQASSNDNKNDLHEPVAARLAKLKMAEDIVSEHQDLFGATGAVLKQREDHHRAIKQKLAYFKKIIADSYATLGEGNDQQSHAQGVAKLTDLLVAKIMQKDGKSLITPEQAELIHDLAELHDLGKSQMSSALMRPWKHLAEGNKQAQDYFTEQNHNHPLFTLLELLIYPNDAKTAAAHHHGVFRYGSDELKHALGEDFDKYTILKDNLKPEQLSPLSFVMRIADVTESMTGRGAKPLDKAIEELGDKAQMQDGKPVIGPGTIHPDYLCLAIKSGVFDAYERNKDLAKVKAAEAKVLEKFGWTGEQAVAKEQALLNALTNDPLLQEPANRSQQVARG